MINNRYNANEQQNLPNGRNSVNNYDNRQKPYKISNSVSKCQLNISNGSQSKLTNGMTNNNNLERIPNRPSSKQNGYPAKSYENSMNHKNGINRLADKNGKSTDEKQHQKDNFNIAVNPRQFLRPTKIEKRQESAKVECETEDINGPYNFRKFLRPTTYLPTESLRKRKSRLVSNGVPLPKDKVPEKHMKRRAPLAPTQNKVTNGKK